MIEGTLASLDVESLFTSVPVLTTISIIYNTAYNHDTELPLPFERKTLKNLLLVYTTELPFTNFDRKTYIQKDVISMGSSLGVIFTSFYMTHIENYKLITHPNLKPKVYCR